MNNILIKINDLTKTYVEGSIRTEVLKGVNLEVPCGKMCAIVGQSGSGKSTLLHILGTLDEATSGEIYYLNTNLNTLKGQKKAVFRNRNIGFIYQFHHLLNDFTVLENIEIPLLIAGSNKTIARNKALQMLDSVKLSHRKNFIPSDLSGGERQRVAIARALINKPALILADEPTGNLDFENAQNVFSLFESLVRESQTTVIMVTHDQELAKRCDIVYKMIDGRVNK